VPVARWAQHSMPGGCWDDAADALACCLTTVQACTVRCSCQGLALQVQAMLREMHPCQGPPGDAGKSLHFVFAREVEVGAAPLHGLMAGWASQALCAQPLYNEPPYTFSACPWVDRVGIVNALQRK
jgi:hypothetical protein